MTFIKREYVQVKELWSDLFGLLISVWILVGLPTFSTSSLQSDSLIELIQLVVLMLILLLHLCFLFLWRVDNFVII